MKTKLDNIVDLKEYRKISNNKKLQTQKININKIRKSKKVKLKPIFLYLIVGLLFLMIAYFSQLAKI